MFDYDAAMADTTCRLFTNINQTSERNDKSDYDYMYDDFGTQVLPDDLVMKVVFKKKDVVNIPHSGKFEQHLVTVTFAKYVTIDNYVELMDDIGIEYQDYSFAMEGRDYLQQKLEGALDRE
ncbi:hypothetical protein P7D66_08675 [Enterococcus avium]|uniref:hypothetical protein n=1 Tax=Enterococcus avium TaxID=33945 RepID=UPI0028928AFE|nr:hypothetical protein [Enterococcus avium]MDT2422450.1 hypothetical protein [Enterococcus avium]